jgi:hypothetical protein
MYCATHKLADMINIHAKRCTFAGCTTQPTYGYPGQKAVYCALHRLSGMLDVNYTACKKLGCLKHPSYAFPGEHAQFCSSHCSKGMVDVKRWRRSSKKQQPPAVTHADPPSSDVIQNVTEDHSAEAATSTSSRSNPWLSMPDLSDLLSVAGGAAACPPSYQDALLDSFCDDIFMILGEQLDQKKEAHG